MFADAAVEVSECQNYIRVLVKKKHNSLYVCGTNAFKPICRTYVQEPDGKYRKTHKDTAVKAICPFDPSHNTTAIYADGNLYSATVSDFSAQDSLIFESTHMLRTVQFDSKWLNEPNFVSSMEKDDLVYFFFRETAVENINCGKAVFSRVARVCKKDRGGNILLLNTFTSFFKARLNCSIPGDFPFYFDEIQSTTEMGKGNYRATFDSGDRSDMVYGVFNTPSAQFTKIAVDWQVHAADDRYYDVMFVGTDDGRVIKAVNKGETAKIETVVIEDIRVFDSHDPVTDLKVYRDKAKVEENNVDTVVLVTEQENTVDKKGENESGPRVGQSSEETPEAAPAAASVETLAIAIVVSIVMSLLLGFFVGYKVAGCRGARNADASYMERTCSLQRGRNRLSSGEHPAYYNPDHVMPKQMNYVLVSQH
nr:hypothetical protein BaRGS_002514 [Batillaria attramentaria]